jgi:hypothetical protein
MSLAVGCCEARLREWYCVLVCGEGIGWCAQKPAKGTCHFIGHIFNKQSSQNFRTQLWDSIHWPK